MQHAGEKKALTLVVDANVDTLLTGTEHVGTVCDGSKTSGGGRLSLQLVDLSLVPAFSFTVAKLLDDVVGVKEVHANLPTCLSGRIPEVGEELAHLSATTVGDGSKRGTINGAEVEVIAGPYAV